MKVKKTDYKEIKFVNEAEKREIQRYIENHDKKENKKRASINTIFRFVRYTFYTPLAIVTSFVSGIAKLTGGITAIGIPYGIYCTYKAIVLWKGGAALSDIKQTSFIIMFLIFPFVSFALSYLLENISDWLTCNK